MAAEFDLAVTDRLLTTTRSVRRRLDLTRPVNPALVYNCLRIALQAATGGNVQRWRWVVVADAAKRRTIGDIYARAFREILALGQTGDEAPAPADVPTEAEYHRKFTADLGAQQRLTASVEFLIEHMRDVPIQVIPCAVGRIRPGDTSHWVSAQYGSVYPAVWNLQLALRSRGLGSCITGAHLAYEEEVAELLNIPFDEVMQVCLLPIAHYTGGTFKPARRRPLEQVVFVDAFDPASLEPTGW